MPSQIWNTSRENGFPVPPKPEPKPMPVLETPTEIERARELIKRAREERSCHTSGGKVKIEHNLEEIKNEASKNHRIYQDRKFRTIFRVPAEIYSCDEKAYKPKAVCIGPFFYGQRKEPHLESMQSYKWACVHKYMYNDSPNLLRKCLTKMEELEQCVRNCYSELFPCLRPHKFTKMLFLDGLFLLDLLLRHAASGEKPAVQDVDALPVVGRLWIWNLVKYDLLLLQNQIPFIVIRSLYDILLTENIVPVHRNVNLVDCAINLFSTLDPCRKQNQTKFFYPVECVEHLLHLIYLSVLPCPQNCRSSEKTKSPDWIPSATELKRDGMKFKKRKNEGGFLSFLDVKFSGRVMEIPQLKLHDYSVSLFRNFIAFEQCYADTDCQITVYAFFMDYLITTEKDVRLLNRKDVLISGMTVDKDSAQKFFSNLCKEVHVAQDKNYLQKLYTDVTEYHHSWLPMSRAYVFRRTRDSPWTVFGIIVAIVLALFRNKL